MLKIAICDDEMEVANEVERYILQYGDENDIDFQIDKYSSGEALLKADLCFDVIFLDIIMKKINGIETGKAIKNNNIKTHIVYITNFANYSMSAHKVHAFDFIEKPIDYLKMSEVLGDLVKYMSDNQATAEYIRVKTDSGAETLINVDDIRYFKYKESRKVIMCTSDDNKNDDNEDKDNDSKDNKDEDKGIVIRDTIYELYERLNKSNFFIPHRAYIINFKFVLSADLKEFKITMTNGEDIYISQKKRKEFKEELHKYMRAKGL